MKKIILAFCLVFVSLFIRAQTFNMGNSTQVINCASTYTFYDSGGSGATYSSNENFTLTMVAGTAGQCLNLAVNAFSVQNNGADNLTIYDGPSVASGTLIGTYYGGAAAPPPSNMSSSSGSLTFVFVSNNLNNQNGWEIVITCGACPGPSYLMNNTNVALTCPSSSIFYDSGGSAGNYVNNENLTKTFSAPAGSCLQIVFNAAFATESCCDRLKIFDGPTGASPSLGTYNGASGPGVIVSSGSSITFSFTSDFSNVAAGWSATITCVAACSGTPAGGTALNTAGTCPPAGSVALSVSGAGTGCGITYQWQSSPAGAGPWTNVAGATSSTLLVTSNATFYRRLTLCGANTGTSTSIQANSSTAIPCSLSTYTSAATTYSFEVFAGTVLPTTDDVLFTTLVNFGFSFCYGGSQYWGGYVGSNGAFVFDAVPCFPNIQTSTYASGGVSTGYSIPSAAPVNSTSIPRNAVLGPWQDIDPSVGGTIQYYTAGTSPNRKFVLSFENIPMFSCNAKKFTGQIKLFETSNNIEIHVGNKPVCATWNNGEAVMGLHNYDGTVYIPPVNSTMHNAVGGAGPYNQWTMSNTAYLFQSPCAVNSGPCAVLPVGFKDFYGEQVDFVNKLYWETSEESGIKEFIIERSTDAINFKEIGIVKPDNHPSTYIFSDNEFRPGVINYYKITAVEFSNQRKSTFIYPIGGAINDLTVSDIFPNPTSQTFNISFISKMTTNLIISVKGMYGREISSSLNEIDPGVTTLNLNSSHLAPGFYIVEVSDALMKKVVSQQKLLITN